MLNVYDDLKLQKKGDVILKNQLEESKCKQLKLEDSFLSINTKVNSLHKNKEREFALLDKVALLEKELEEAKRSLDTNANLVKIIYEEKIKRMQEEFESSQSDLQCIIRNTQTSLESRRVELDKILENQRMTIKLVSRLEGEVSDLQFKQGEMEKVKKKLEMTLASRDKIISGLKFQAHNAKLKIGEACEVVQQAVMEKDAALVREKNAQDEIVKLMKTLGEILKDSTVVMSPCHNQNKSDVWYPNE